jgi:ankyrin repeat protein
MKNANVGPSSAIKPKVKFPDELVFLDSIKDNDVENVKQMLRRASLNVDLNKINDSGKTNFIQLLLFLFLIELMLESFSPLFLGLTALHQAVLENSFELVRILLENKANINHPDEDSWTPLHAACAMGYLEMSK